MNKRSTHFRSSRRAFLQQVGQAVALSLFAACTPVAQNEDDPFTAPARDDLPATALPPLPTDFTPQLGQYAIPLAQKIGQMLLVGFSGTSAVGNPILHEIRTHNLGGVALFRRNVESVAQLATLTNDLQAAASIPLLISVDQEGGYVRRLGPEFGLSYNYTPQQLGALNNLTTTRDYATETAQTLHNLGINLNLAPVVDLNVNPSNPVIGRVGRSFSSDPTIVAEQARAFIDAHHKQGVFCTLKHFPGHGSSTDDSHDGFVDVTATWTERELEPFARMISTDHNDVVMTAHIFNATWDTALPATLSHNVITGILREELGHDGVIMTDDMQMGAITRYYSFDHAIALAIQAGVDMIAIARYSTGIIDRAVNVIQAQVADGSLSPARIDASYTRIMRLKTRLSARPTSPAQRLTPLPIPPSMLPGEKDLL